jgi:MFS family permease
VAVKLNRYLDVLRAPGVGRLALFTLVGRFPFAIVGLSIILLMRREGYGYGDIGLVSAGEGLAIALTGAFLGRLADRRGRSRVILVCGGATAAQLTGLTAAILAGAPVALLVALSALYGGTIPPISASMRSLWGALVPENRVESAYAFDTVQLEVVFIIGPLIAAGLATALTPAAGLFLCAGLYVVAATGFATAPVARSAAGEADAPRTRAGALSAPGMRTLVALALLAAVSFGAIDIALPAFSEQEGSRAAAGPLLTAWALGSVLGGLWYGSRSWRTPAEHRLIALSGLLALGSAPIVFAWSIPAMGVLLVLAGLSIAPLGTTEYALVEKVTPRGTSTEAYSWHIVATAVGFSLGATGAGLLAEQVDVAWALAGAALASAAGFLIALFRRETLRSVAR